MTNSNLSDYINKAREQKLTDDTIRKNLTDAGWDKKSVDESLGLTVPTPLVVPNPPSTNQIPVDNYWNWDSFEHILMFLSLYTLLIAIGITLYYFVDKAFPLPKMDQTYSIVNSDFDDTMLSGTLSAIIVSLPLFSFFFLNILKRTKINPGLRNIFARKRLIYMTLVVTFIIMLQNLIGVISSFLNGNLVANSLAHFTVVVGLSLIVFIYFLDLVSQDKYATVK